MQNLNGLIASGSAWQIIDASQINNRGQILAVGINGPEFDYLLLTPAGLPTPGSAMYPTIVPEPSTWVFFATILGTFMIRRQGKRG